MAAAPPGGRPASDPIATHGGELWHCFRHPSSCCLGFFCPAVLFGINLKSAGVRRDALSGCLLYVLLSWGIVWAVGALSNRSFSSYLGATPHPTRTRRPAGRHSTQGGDHAGLLDHAGLHPGCSGLTCMPVQGA